MRPRRDVAALALAALLVGGAARGQVEASARLDLPEAQAWCGQQLRVFVELRAPGSFSGAPSFDLPEIPRSVLIRLGSPVLSSETEGDEEVFVQRHELALFSQADGSLELPPIGVRFSHKRGYTGPDHDVEVRTEPARVELRRPPGTEALGFVVTTERLEVEERWEPDPAGGGEIEVGAVFEREITQRADGLTGIALAPAPRTAPEGIRVYAKDPQVADSTERGALSAERRDRITYLVREPGRHELPALRYSWWNPRSESLESKLLPAVTLVATAPPPPPAPPSPARHLRWVLPLLALAAALAGRRPLGRGLARLRDRLAPPSKRAARAFLRACRRDDVDAALDAWASWRRRVPRFEIDEALETPLLELQRRRYGAEASEPPWSGRALAAAFRATGRSARAGGVARSPLPPLNA